VGAFRERQPEFRDVAFVITIEPDGERCRSGGWSFSIAIERTPAK
jgi:hypothetical protein